MSITGVRAAPEGDKKIVRPILSKLMENFNLDKEEIDSVIDSIRAEQLSDVQIAGFLVGLPGKGPSTKEVAYISLHRPGHAP
jgi:anthranilate phosphoribosyltransferase